MAYRAGEQTEYAEVGAILEAEVFAIARAWADGMKQQAAKRRR